MWTDSVDKVSRPSFLIIYSKKNYGVVFYTGKLYV